jgi:hypothetical protein
MSHFRLEAREMEKGTRTTDATVLVVDDDVSVTQVSGFKREFSLM